MGKPAQELTHADPEFLPVQYDMTAAKIKALTKEYDPKSIPKAAEKGDEGYLVIHDKVMSIVKVRTRIDKVRKDLKADALAWGKKVDGEARRLTTIVEALEAPWRDIKTELDEKEAREAEEARQVEIKRMEEIEARIQDIKMFADGLLGASAEQIQNRITAVSRIIIDEDQYGDYEAAAETTRSTILDTLNAAWNERTAFEKGEAKLAKEKTELKEQQDALAKEKAELKASQELAERRRLEEENRVKEESERQAREAAEAEAEKKRLAANKKRQPENLKVRAYIDEVVGIKQPAVKDRNLVSLLAKIFLDLQVIKDDAYSHTSTEEK